MSRGSSLNCVLGLTLLCAAHGAAAAENGVIGEKFSLSLGTYFMSSDTRIRADEIAGTDVGTEIDLEDTFGFDDENVFRAEAMWRFKPRHKLRLMYFSSSRSATQTLSEEISFRDTTFPLDATVRADFDFDIAELAYEYEFLRRDRYEVGASIGIHNVGFATRLSGSITSPGVSGSISRSEKADADAPLPVVGLRGTWRMFSDFYLQAHAQYFQLEFGDYSGSIEDYQVGVLWALAPHLGVGVAYNLFDTNVDADDGDKFQGSLDWKYDGGQIFLRLAF